MNALQTLASRLVDYAGLFPPAELPMAEVVRNYQEYLAGPNRWMLGRLIVPASRLEEFAAAFQSQFPVPLSGSPWQISALVPEYSLTTSALDLALEQIRQFNESFSFAQVDAIEGHLASEGIAGATLERAGNRLAIYLEIPCDLARQRIPELAGAIVGAGGADPGTPPRICAKLRAGGTRSDSIPSAKNVAQFIETCRRCGVGFKATAGLHHPLRGQYPLTYDAVAEQGRMHGFVNLFVAACLSFTRAWAAEQLVEVLDVSSPDRFEFGDHRLSFDGMELTLDEIRKTRRMFALSFGSCSFVEPVDELKRPGWLAETAKSVQ
jgi:hypothetical protein